MKELKEVSERAIGSLAFLPLDADRETVFSIQPRFVFTALSPFQRMSETGWTGGA